MELHLDRVRDEPFAWEEQLSFSPRELEGTGVVVLSPVECRGRLSFVDPGFFLEAHLRYEQTLTCTRCLEPTVMPVEARVELLLLVEPGGGEEERSGEVELDEEDLSVVVLHEEKIDTEPVLLEQVRLNVPMKPLCRPDCAGLCPVCGADRNRGGCSCEEATTDPRWAALAGLRDRLSDDRREH